MTPYDAGAGQVGAVPPPPVPPPPPAWPGATTQWPPAEQGWPSPQASDQVVPTVPTLAAPLTIRDRVRKITAPIAAGLAALWKLKIFLVIAKIKFLGVAISMAVSVAAYAWLFGWKFAVGFVLLILVHELGHVIVLRARGIKAGLPVFVPFMGAFVSMKEQPKSVYDEALSGIAGPAFGTAAAALVAWAAYDQGSALLKALAFTGFFLNLFNLLPVLPLDGGRTAAALHPALWGVGLVGLAALFVVRPTPIIPLILILGGHELYQRWKGRETEESRRYYAIRPGQRAFIGVAYLGLVTVLVLAMNATYVHRTFS